MHTSLDYRLLSYSLAVNYNGLWRNYLRCSRASGLFLIIGHVCNVCSPTLAPKRCLTIWNKRHLPSNSSSSRATGRVPTKLRHQKPQIAVRGPNISRQLGPQEEATRNDPAPKDSQLTQHGTITHYRDRADAPVHGRLEQEYPYASLTKAGNILLLHLIPSREHDGRIEARLVEYPLLPVTRAMHLYEALSYSWVTGGFSRSIYIDGLELLVTHNLHEALLRLRDPENVRVLWIDVICINQSNDTEKQGQIPLMPRIYSMANRVIIWLGTAGPLEARAFEVVGLAHISPCRALNQKRPPFMSIAQSCYELWLGMRSSWSAYLPSQHHDANRRASPLITRKENPYLADK